MRSWRELPARWGAQGSILDQLETVAVQARLLWPAGAALVIALGVAAMVQLPDFQRVWIVFFALGTALPAILALVMVFDPRKVPANLMRVAAGFGLLLSGFALVAGLVHAAFYRYEPIAGLVQVLAVLVLTGAMRGSGKEPAAASRIGTILLWAAVSIGAWGVAGSLLWWRALGGFRDVWVLVVFVGAALIVFGAQWRPDAIANRLVGWAGAGIALALLAVASVRTNNLWDPTTMYHWEFYVGPAELVRQGGWLLWDVPSQYGFLSELAIAWIPTPSAWESLFILNSVMSFLLAATVFMLLRSLGRGILNLVMSFALALVVTFFRPGLAPQIIGPDGYPSTGAFRFLWCVALLLVLLSLLRVHSSRARIAILMLGNVVWVVGFLWSAESAIYSTFVWLPGYFLMVVADRWHAPSPHRGEGQQGGAPGTGSARLGASRGESPLRQEGRGLGKRLLRIAGWTVVPMLFLAAALAIVFIVYQVGLGHGPDLEAFYDFGRAYQGGFGAYPMDPGGPGWVLFLVYAATLVAIVWSVRKQPGVATAVLVGTAAMIYATGSYFAGRSHPNAVWNLAPLLCIALAVTLSLSGRNVQAGPLPVLLRLVATPLLIIFLFGALSDRAAAVDWVTRPQHDIVHIDTAIPPTDPGLQALIAQHVRPGERIVYLSDDADPVLTPHLFADTEQPDGAPLWLPLVPFRAVNILPQARRALYLERYIERHPEGGWLIERTPPPAQVDWVVQIVQAHFTSGPTYSNADYQLTLWSPRK